MKRLSFIIAILGILLLLFLISFQKPVRINLYEDISPLATNQKILIKGIATKQSSSSIMINNITILCSSCPPYLNKNLSIEGIIKENYNSKVIYALKIKEANHNNN